MKILITGGAGFIGSNIADAYIANGNSVVIVDDLSSGKQENVNPKAKFYKTDIRDEGIEKIFETEKPDMVNHLAAQIDVRKSVANPINDAMINVIGMLNIMQNCIKYKVKKVIAVSSGGVVYGEPKVIPTPETEPIEPLCPYGVTKFTMELYLNYYFHTYGLKYTTMRYSNVYGPRQDPHGEAGVIAIFTSRLMGGKPCTIFGDGKANRDYVFVRDVVKANVLALEKGDREAFNIATGKMTSVNELYKMMADICGVKEPPAYAPARLGELQNSCLKVDKAKKLLGWQPEHTIEEGLRITIEWFKERLK